MGASILFFCIALGTRSKIRNLCRTSDETGSSFLKCCSGGVWGAKPLSGISVARAFPHVKKSKFKFANRLKRALPKFRDDRSQVRGVNGRSKFVVAVLPAHLVYRTFSIDRKELEQQLQASVDERMQAKTSSIRAAFDRYDRYGNCSICSIDPIDSIFEKVRKIQNATFEGIKPIVPGFFRIGFRFERIPGRSAYFFQKCQKWKIPLLKELSRTSRGSFGLDSDSKESRDDRLNSFKSDKNGKCHF